MMLLLSLGKLPGGQIRDHLHVRAGTSFVENNMEHTEQHQLEAFGELQCTYVIFKYKSHSSQKSDSNGLRKRVGSGE